MRVSRSGLVVAAVYVVLAVASIVWGRSLPDPKESSVLMGLPLLPALLVIHTIGLDEWLADAPWFVTCGLLVPAIAAGLYAASWLFGALGFRTRLVIGAGALALLSVMLFWPNR